MKTILVLGSKPNPTIPDSSEFQDVACANASGYSAAMQQLPIPKFTVISAIVTSGIPSGRQSLSHLKGLRTETLYYLPQLTGKKGIWKKIKAELPALHREPRYLEWRLMMRPWFFKWKLNRLDYRYKEFKRMEYADYVRMIVNLCDRNTDILSQMASKRPSTGLFAIALALSMPEYQRVVITGFSFELTHAYGLNPEIAERGTKSSRHAHTDTTILRHLASRNQGRLFTTESVVNQSTGVSMLSGSRG